MNRVIIIQEIEAVVLVNQVERVLVDVLAGKGLKARPLRQYIPVYPATIERAPTPPQAFVDAKARGEDRDEDKEHERDGGVGAEGVFVGWKRHDCRVI
jgi:hypothetical protein